MCDTAVLGSVQLISCYDCRWWAGLWAIPTPDVTPLRHNAGSVPLVVAVLLELCTLTYDRTLEKWTSTLFTLW